MSVETRVEGKRPGEATGAVQTKAEEKWKNSGCVLEGKQGIQLRCGNGLEREDQML